VTSIPSKLLARDQTLQLFSFNQISNYADNDAIDLFTLIGDFDVLTATTAAVADGAALGASGAVQTYTGTWAAGVFTSTAAADANALLVVYDNNGVEAGATYEAIVLIGVTAASIMDGVMTV